MGWRYLASIVVWGVVTAACAKEGDHTRRNEPAPGSGSVHVPGATPRSPDAGLEIVWDYTEPLCPRDKGPRKTAARKTGDWIRIVPQEVGYVVQRRKPGKLPKDHALHIYSEQGTFIETIPGEKEPGSVLSFDSAAWYSAPCEEGTCDARGYGHELFRVDRVTGKSEKLYGPEHAFVHGQPFGDHFYWASSGVNHTTGALRRVPRKGKKVETLWKGRGVASVLFMPDVALLADKHSLFAIPLDGSPAKELVKDMTNAQGIAADGNQVYVVDRESFDRGRLLVADRITGESSVLATDLPAPTVIAVDSTRVFIMGEGHGNVIVVPRKGGTPKLHIPAPRADWSCHTTRWIRSDARGLRWLRMHAGDKRGQMFFIERWMLGNPVVQWDGYMAKRSQAGSGSGEAADRDGGADSPAP